MVLERRPAEHMPEHLLQNSISTLCLETELREMTFLHQQNSSTPAHMSIPSMQGEMLLLAANHLLGSSVCLTIPEESLQDNRKPT